MDVDSFTRNVHRLVGECECASRIEVVDHGTVNLSHPSHSVQQVHHGTLPATAFAHVCDDLCDSVVVRLWGCWVGKNTAYLDRIKAQCPSKTMTVMACDNYVRPPAAFVRVLTCTGQWVGR